MKVYTLTAHSYEDNKSISYVTSVHATKPEVPRPIKYPCVSKKPNCDCCFRTYSVREFELKD